MVMTDRAAEGTHCGELGQGVALFGLIVPILYCGYFLFSLIAIAPRSNFYYFLICLFCPTD